MRLHMYVARNYIKKHPKFLFSRNIYRHDGGKNVTSYILTLFRIDIMLDIVTGQTAIATEKGKENDDKRHRTGVP